MPARHLLSEREVYLHDQARAMAGRALTADSERFHERYVKFPLYKDGSMRLQRARPCPPAHSGVLSAIARGVANQPGTRGNAPSDVGSKLAIFIFWEGRLG